VGFEIERDPCIDEDDGKWQEVNINGHKPNACSSVENVHAFLGARTITVNNPHLAIITFLIFDITELVNLAFFGRSVLDL